jgi:hypothetical protein
VTKSIAEDPEVEENYEFFRAMVDQFSPADAARHMRRLKVPENIVRRIVERHEQECVRVRDMDEPHSVYRHNRMTWYTGPNGDDRNWPAFEKSLREKGRDEGTISSVDDASTKIVSLLEHPKLPEFSTRGLVVGFVQSGKTTNFTAVMAKAADRGYKLFIVLSGIHNALRKQTQVRLKNDLIAPNLELWHEVTTPERDFGERGNAAAYLAAKDQHLLLVVKKNAAVLRKLDRWLSTAREYLGNCPTLIIDDEADQSTVATKKINPLLHRVMKNFPKVGYVGYTATPFANLLIDPSADDDFYPRDFIVNLPRPAGHQGTEILFGREPLDWEDAEDVPGGYDMIRQVPKDEVDDLKPPNKKEAATFSPAGTSSLRAAVHWFWLATAARRVRGTGDPHSSMLIHTSVDSGVHFSFVPVLQTLRTRLSTALTRQDVGVLDELRQQWRDETTRVRAADFGEAPVSFEELLAHLRVVVDETIFVVDNYRSKHRLDYDSGPVTAIAIGGNTLSRGLTLEGLVSSLFVRGASAYDTLLQMGRWFGYRGGYADLPRIWMTDELQGWFRHLATVEAEMRVDIDRYMTTNETPMTFAVRLRSHPKLLITAKAKMKDAVKAQAAYGGHLIESRYFDVRPQAKSWLDGNAEAAKSLIGACDAAGLRQLPPRPHRVLYRDVPHELVTAFLDRYEFHANSTEAERARIVGYIEKRLRAGSLKRWNVAVVGSARKNARPYDIDADTKIGMVKRGRIGGEPLSQGDEPADIKTLTSARDTTLDLDLSNVTEDLKRSDIELLRRAQAPDVGLLLLYPVDPVSHTAVEGRAPLNAPADVVLGAALLFPQPTGKDDEIEAEFEYFQANLVEQDDIEALEADEEDDE